MAKTEKSEDKHDEEQIENLIKPAPKKKPPRTDREKRRIKTRDSDTDSKDKDLSMNYKDIGGSAQRVLMRYLTSFKLVEKTEESVPAPKLTEEQILEGALGLYSMSNEELVSKLSDPSQKEFAQKALRLRMDPLPPNWEPEEVFEHAQLRLRDRGRLRRHMADWDAATYLRNITYYKERKLNESLTTGRDDRVDYFDALLVIGEESYAEFQAKEGAPLKSLQDAMHLLRNPNDQFVSSDALDEAVLGWRHRLKRTSQEHLSHIREELDLALREDLPQDTNLYHWLTALRNLVHGATAMQDKLDPKMIAASLRKGMSKHAQYRGVPGYEPRELLPDAPKWSRPDPRELTSEDFSKILLDAVSWLNSDFLKVDLLNYDPDMACRIALDYAIYAYEEGKYQSRVDAPTYEKLAGILQRVLEGSVQGT